MPNSPLHLTQTSVRFLPHCRSPLPQDLLHPRAPPCRPMPDAAGDRKSTHWGSGSGQRARGSIRGAPEHGHPIRRRRSRRPHGSFASCHSQLPSEKTPRRHLPCRGRASGLSARTKRGGERKEGAPAVTAGSPARRTHSNRHQKKR